MRTISENLVQYLVDNGGLTDTEIIDTVIVDSDPEALVLVRETGGSARNWPDNRQDAGVQVLSRASDDATARNYIYDAWDTLRTAEHGVTLPASSVVTGSASVYVERINVDQRPFSLGVQDDYFWWSFNFVVTYFA